MRGACAGNLQSDKNGAMTGNCLRILCGLMAMAAAACSNFGTRFARECRASGRGDPFAGAYLGRWESSSHPGTGGRLRCILEKAGGPAYAAEFEATWHGIFSSRHTVVLRTTPASRSTGRGPEARTFAGTATIRMFIGAGTYRCEGRMDGRRMRACYDATYDRGTFDMERVQSSR
jgi:hypothetical protein